MPHRVSLLFRAPRGVLWFLAVLAAALFLPQASAQVRLSEFLAVNETGLTDEDGERHGWIEIWNASPTAKASLNNYKLGNAATLAASTQTWTFPNVEIMPDERMIVWASGKDRKVLTAPLHTNFTLPAGGGTLALFNASAQNAISVLADFPAQQADHSWGRDEVDTETTAVLAGRYALPTPEARNNYEGPGVAGRVLFSETSRAFAKPDAPTPASITISLTQATPAAGAKIFYTLDRSLPQGKPRQTSATPPVIQEVEYTGPITLTSTHMIRARVFQDGLLPGETASEAYLKLEDTTKNFSSTMPVLVLTNFLTTQPPDTGDQAAFLWLWQPAIPGATVRLADPPTFTSRIVIDKRGSSTLGNAKFNLNMETRNAWDEDERDYALLGMPQHSDWVLHAPFAFDPSLLHNPFAYALSNSVGRYATRNVMAEVFVDITRPASNDGLTLTGTNNGDYFGVYNVFEKIRRNNDRVDVTRLNKYDNDTVSKTGGFIWKVDRLDPGDSGFNAGGQSFAYYYPKEVDVKSPQRDPQEQHLASNSITGANANDLSIGYIARFNAALQRATFTDPVLGYAPYLDVPAALDHHLVNTWTFNVDALRLSGFWHKERGGKMTAGPVWDFDRALSSTDGRDSNPATWRSRTGDLGTDFFNYTWWNRLFRDPNFYQQYIDRWQELRRPGQAFSLEKINALLDQLNSEISDESVFRDLQRWRNSKRAWTSPFTGTVYPGENYVASGANATTVERAAEGQDAEVQRLKDYLQQRANFMDSQWVGPVTASTEGGRVAPGTEITLTGPEGATIYYTLNGEDPRPFGGQVGPSPAFVPALTPGTRFYTGPVKIHATSLLKARAFKPNHTALTGANNPPLVSKWGGLSTLRFSTDPAPALGDLVISEINFNPLNPTTQELAAAPGLTGNSFEFVEIRNVSGKTIDLTGLKIADGVSFEFTGAAARSLPPGGHVIVASEPASLAVRYGSDLGAVGPWSGNLSNGGEILTLRAADNSILFSILYDDGWATAADGGGFTLTAYNTTASAGDFNSAANWRASAAQHGSPGLYDGSSIYQPELGPDFGGPTSGITITAQSLGGQGLTPGAPPVLAWSKISGPGEAAFTPGDALSTLVTFSEPGAYVLRLTATHGEGSTSDDVTVYAQQTPAAWLAANPSIGALGDDPDGDGRDNFLEYALGSDPLAANAAAPPAATLEGGLLTVVYTRLTPPGSVSYQAQITEDFATWRTPLPGEVYEEILSSDGFTQTVRLTDTTILRPGVTRYLRVKITGP